MIVKQKLTKFLLQSFILLFLSLYANAQKSNSYLIGKEKDFTELLMNATLEKSSIKLELPNNKNLDATISVRKIYSDNNYFITGKINNIDNSFFSVTKTNGLIQGHIIFFNKKTGYKYLTGENGDILIKEVSIDDLICVGLKKRNTNNSKNYSSNTNTNTNEQVPILNSLPGAAATIYLDFDGEYVSGTIWNNGGAIDAQPMGLSSNQIKLIWNIISEDYSPFQVNVTTDRNVFNNTPRYKRVMVIFTKTNTAAPGSGGVAYLNTFSQNNDNPCWVFSGGPNSPTNSAEAGSHEIGHTVGLHHDGQGANTYHFGNDIWCPIMGASYFTNTNQFSKGEYPNSTENEDDLQIITRTQNFGYKPDDHGSSINTATELVHNGYGDVYKNDNQGIIERNTDKDVFSFLTPGGTVNFDLTPATISPNLNIQARILDNSGNEVAFSNPIGDLSASITTNLSAGAYYIEIDGKGEDLGEEGYTEYGSIGAYSISGNFTFGSNNQPPIVNFIADVNCSEVTFNNNTINSVTSYNWDFGDGTTTTEENPTHIYQNSGSYTVSLTATNSIGSDTKTETNFITLEVANAPNSAYAKICDGEIIEDIELTGSNGYIWYDQFSGGEIVNTGSTIDLSEITSSTTYYVSGTADETTEASVGLENINNSNGNIHQGGYRLIFDAEQPFILKQAKVFAEGTAIRTLELKDNTGTNIITKEINIQDGESIIDINLSIPAGEDLQIGFANDSQLFRNNTGVNYPYTVNNVVSIKASTANEDPTSYYYYLYDWKIATLGNCESPSRTEIIITVDEYPDTPIITYDPATDQLSTANNYYNYQWYLDGVAISGANSYTYTVQETGDYSVEYSNTNGCSSVSEVQEITINLNVSDFIKNNIKIYPNPLNNYLYIESINIDSNLIKGKIFDSRGRLIKIIDFNQALNQTAKVDVSKLSSGIYFINVSSEKGQGIFKLIKQ